jgi:hypothetical protein
MWPKENYYLPMQMSKKIHYLLIRCMFYVNIIQFG